MLFLTALGSIRSICRLTALAAILTTIAAHAQVVPSATGPHHGLWLGAEYSNIDAGFPFENNQRLWGIGGFADYHVTSHIDIQAELRFLRFNSFYGETEDNYLAGPRYVVGRFGKLEPFAQCLAGIGKIQYPFKIGSGSYLAVAPGAGADYRISRRWSLTGEYEYQFWPSSPGIAGQPAHMIAPSGFHGGIAFRLLR